MHVFNNYGHLHILLNSSEKPSLYDKQGNDTNPQTPRRSHFQDTKIEYNFLPKSNLQKYARQTGRSIFTAWTMISGILLHHRIVAHGKYSRNNSTIFQYSHHRLKIYRNYSFGSSMLSKKPKQNRVMKKLLKFSGCPARLHNRIQFFFALFLLPVRD